MIDAYNVSLSHQQAAEKQLSGLGALEVQTTIND